MSDTRFDGHFHYKFEMQFNADGERVFCEGYGCEEFRLHALRIGEGIVPVSLVLYVDGTSTFTNISVRPVTVGNPAKFPIPEGAHQVNIMST